MIITFFPSKNSLKSWENQFCFVSKQWEIGRDEQYLTLFKHVRYFLMHMEELQKQYRDSFTLHPAPVKLIDCISIDSIIRKIKKLKLL